MDVIFLDKNYNCKKYLKKKEGCTRKQMGHSMGSL
jgi:hypothetical protein